MLASDEHRVYLIDSNPSNFNKITPSPYLITTQIDVNSEIHLAKFVQSNDIKVMVACLPYFINIKIAELAAKSGCNYFDLTEDVATVAKVQELAIGKSEAFVSRCGVAPGYIDILAYHLIQKFEILDKVKLRAGCLPQHASNSLHYALAWSVDGLINEYGNLCEAIVDGHKVFVQPLEDIEMVELDGVMYEAFNTSGGIGGLATRMEGKVNTLNYKSMRYPGHVERMRFLMKDMQLNTDRDALKKMLLRVLPKTDKDVMIIYVSVTGTREGEFVEENTVKKIYPKELYGHTRSAIQVATASAAASVIDIVLSNKNIFQGFVNQEDISLEKFLSSRFAEPFLQS
jgi:saccharopine dehydrogenase-like NADP-dependent oxidoreductase